LSRASSWRACRCIAGCPGRGWCRSQCCSRCKQEGIRVSLVCPFESQREEVRTDRPKPTVVAQVLGLAAIAIVNGLVDHIPPINATFVVADSARIWLFKRAIANSRVTGWPLVPGRTSLASARASRGVAPNFDVVVLAPLDERIRRRPGEHILRGMDRLGLHAVFRSDDVVVGLMLPPPPPSSPSGHLRGADEEFAAKASLSRYW